MAAPDRVPQHRRSRGEGRSPGVGRRRRRLWRRDATLMSTRCGGTDGTQASWTTRCLQHNTIGLGRGRRAVTNEVSCRVVSAFHARTRFYASTAGAGRRLPAAGHMAQSRLKPHRRCGACAACDAGDRYDATPAPGDEDGQGPTKVFISRAHSVLLLPAPDFPLPTTSELTHQCPHPADLLPVRMLETGPWRGVGSPCTCRSGVRRQAYIPPGLLCVEGRRAAPTQQGPQFSAPLASVLAALPAAPAVAPHADLDAPVLQSKPMPGPLREDGVDFTTDEDQQPTPLLLVVVCHAELAEARGPRGWATKGTGKRTHASSKTSTRRCRRRPSRSTKSARSWSSTINRATAGPRSRGCCRAARTTP